MRPDTWTPLPPDSSQPDSPTPVAGTCAVSLGCSTQADCTKLGLVDCKNGRCVACVTDADCTFGCNTATGMCFLCQQDSDCVMAGVVIGTGKCDPAAWCTHCDTDADCTAATFGTTQHCASIVGGSRMCIGCASDADCANTQLKGCDLASGTCSRCTSDADCCMLQPFTGKSCGQTCNKASGTCHCSTDLQCELSMGPWWSCP